MSGVWPEQAVIEAIRVIMGNIRRDERMPQQRIPECRGSLGIAVAAKLGLSEVDPPKLDDLIEVILRAAVDANAENPMLLASGELLGFSRRTEKEIRSLIEGATTYLSVNEINSGYQSKSVRLYLASLHCGNPMSVRAARNWQKNRWAPAMATALYRYLDQFLDEAKEIAVGLGLKFASDAPPEVPQRELAGPATAEIADAEPPEWPRRDPYAGLLSLAPELEQALNTARNACLINHRDFHTSDVLLVLFALPKGRTASCFEQAGDRPGLSRLVRQRLLEIEGFQECDEAPLEIRERDDVDRACRYALKDTMRVVNDLHLLCAILDGSSETKLGLERLLGDRFAAVRERAGSWRQHQPPTTRTPRMPD